MEGYHCNRNVKIEEEIEENEIPRETFKIVSPQTVQAAPPVNWNVVNTTKIRTTLGGSIGKVKNLVDEPSLTDGGRKESEGNSNRDLGQLILLLVSMAV